MAWAEHEFGLSRRLKAGGTLRDVLETVERQYGRAPAGLIGPPEPELTRYLFAWFLELHARRAYSDYGSPRPIAYTELHAWAVLTRAQPERWEVEVLLRLDDLYRRVSAEPVDGDSSGDETEDEATP